MMYCKFYKAHVLLICSQCFISESYKILNAGSDLVIKLLMKGESGRQRKWILSSVFEGNLWILFKTFFYDHIRYTQLWVNKTPFLTISCASSSCLHWTCSTNGSNLNTASPLDWARAGIWRTNKALLYFTSYVDLIRRSTTGAELSQPSPGHLVYISDGTQTATHNSSSGRHFFLEPGAEKTRKERGLVNCYKIHSSFWTVWLKPKKSPLIKS